MLKKIVAVVMTLALTIAGLNYAPGTADAAVMSSGGSSSWSLVWNDEFNGTSLDTSVWNYDIGGGGWGNAEAQYYTDRTDNVYIADLSSDSGSADGKALAIKAKRESYGGNEFTSGRIHSQNKVYARYGRIESKIRVENGQQSGVWPAFWMLGQNYNASSGNNNGANGDCSWPSCGEIDIMEHRNAETSIIGTIHWNPYTDTWAEGYVGSETTGQFGYIDTIASWHTYAVEWYEDVIKWYVDDYCYQTVDITSSELDEFTRNHFIIFDLAIGTTSTPFTLYQTVDSSFTDATMYVDYVRVYQGNDSDFYISKTTSGETPADSGSTSDGYTNCATNTDVTLGAWKYCVSNSWTGVTAQYKGGDSLDDFSMKVTSNSNATSWDLWASTIPLDVIPGHTYYYSITLNSDTAGASVLMKDEIGDTNFDTKTLVTGDNVWSGTFTATNDLVQFMFDLGLVQTGTTLNWTNVTLIDITDDGESDTQGSGDSGYTGGGDYNEGDYTWIPVEASNGAFDYCVISGDANVVNMQGHNGYDAIYMNFGLPVDKVWINGEEHEDDMYDAIEGGAQCWVYTSVLTQRINEIVVHDTNGGAENTSVILIRNNNVSGGETTTEAPTQAPTDPPTEPATEAPSNAPEAPVGLLYTGNENLPIYFAWAGEDCDYFNVYVNGVYIASVTESDFNGAGYESYFPTGEEITFGVTAVKDGAESDMTTITWTNPYGISSETTTEQPTVETTDSSTTADMTTAGEGDYDWVVVDGSDGKYYYYVLEGEATIVNVQTPGFSPDHTGIYMSVPAGINVVYVNGAEHSDDGIYDEVSGAGVLINLEVIEPGINTIVIEYAGGSATVLIRYDESSDETTETVTETPVETTEETTTPSSTTGGVWNMWSSDNAEWRTFGGDESSWTITNQNIGEYWWSVQTDSPTYDLTAGKTYSCTFTLTADYGTAGIADFQKAYTVDFDAANDAHTGQDAEVFEETDNGKWTDNGDGTYSTTFTGTYVSSLDGSYRVRIGLGYHHGDDGYHAVYDNDAYYPANSSLTVSMTGFEFKEVTEQTTEETTTEPATEPTTDEPATQPSTGDGITLEGYQISTSYEGFRIVGGVEDTIDGKKVESWGFIYALSKYNGEDHGITDDEMYVRDDSPWVKCYESTSAGTLTSKMGDSDTATYFARTMKFGGDTADIFEAEYRVRAYALLEDGSYAYSDIGTFTVYDIADYLYQNLLMNTYDSHVYLYENILTVVDSSYKEVDFRWNNSVVKPGEITW